MGVRVSLGALKSPAKAGLSWFWTLVPFSRLGTWEHVADNMGTAVGTPTGRVPSVSVHRDRGGWAVGWRQDGRHHSRRFKTEPEALAFEAGLAGGAGKPRSSTPNVYPLRHARGHRLALQLPRLPRAGLEQARVH